jgi:hypothetical protein
MDNNDMYWVYILSDVEYVLDIYIGQPHPIHIRDTQYISPIYKQVT